MSPVDKRNLRGNLAIEITRKITFNHNLEIRIIGINKFSTFSPLHLGILEGYYVLFDSSNVIVKILEKAKQIKKKWNSKRIQFDEDCWILLPKGRLVLDQPIIYSESLL